VKVVVTDYGAGNLASVSKALAFVGAAPTLAAEASAIAGAGAIVVPGVGNFESMRALNGEWRDAIAAAIGHGVPVLGICLGMQWLFDGSEEAPLVQGLGAMTGTITILSGDVKVPHVGWNSLERTDRSSVLLRGIPASAVVYFTHSYAAPVTDAAVAVTTHGREFASTVEEDRVFGVQWHPEKSGAVGLAVLSNFVAFAREVAETPC
jgi:glutamine amidotransferase